MSYSWVTLWLTQFKVVFDFQEHAPKPIWQTKSHLMWAALTLGTLQISSPILYRILEGKNAFYTKFYTWFLTFATNPTILVHASNFIPYLLYLFLWLCFLIPSVPLKTISTKVSERLFLALLWVADLSIVLGLPKISRFAKHYGSFSSSFLLEIWREKGHISMIDIFIYL